MRRRPDHEIQPFGFNFVVTAAQLFRGSARRRPDHEIKPFGFNFVVMAAKIFRGSARRRYHEILRRPDHEIKIMTTPAGTDAQKHPTTA